MADKRMPGYVFPNPPMGWSQEEKNFALALRMLFDELYVRTRGLGPNYSKDSYNSLKDKPSISNTVLQGNRSLSDIGIHDVNASGSGLMTAELFSKLDGIDTATASTEGLMPAEMFTKLEGIEEGATASPDLRPEVDYLSMMTGIDIPTDTSDKVEKVGSYYEAETWNKQMVWDAVDRGWITDDDYEDITGEPFPPFRPD